MSILIVGLVILTVAAISLGLWIGIPLLIRWLADRGIFWFRLPEMHACFILKDKKLRKILIACSNEIKKASLADITEDEKYGELFSFVNEGLVWIGLPWFGYELYSWYELSKDDENSETDPRYILYLGERTWDYTTPESATETEKKEFIHEWGVDTADPIQVTPKLVATAEVMHPAKAVFDVKYFQEAILKDILTGWRVAVKDLEYFTYGKKSTDELSDDESAEIATGSSGMLHIEAQKKLNAFLFGKDKIEGEKTPEEYEDDSPAKRFYEVYGIWLKRVRIRDIDPTESKIRENLQKKLVAQTGAAAEVESAKGNRDSTKIKADGKIYETENVGKAEADVIRMKLEAKGSGLEDISKKLKLEDGENKILFAADMAVRMAENSQYTYLAGMPGDIGTWIIAAADQMRGGINKVKTGSNGESKIGFEEIKKAFSGLDSEKQKELLKMAEKIKESKGKESKEK